MKLFFETLSKKINENELLFYNSQGDPQAYKLGVKHLSSAPFLGFGYVHQGILYVTQDFTLVDFEKEQLTLILKGSKLTITPLADA